MADGPLWSGLLLQVCLIALNAFFAASEIAVISLNEKKLRKQAEEGDRKAQRMLGLVEAPTAFLSTIQVGITLAGFLGSAFAADNFAGKISSFFINEVGITALSARTINTLAVIVVTLILSFFTLVLGELVPKRVAMKKSEQIAALVSGVIQALSVVMKPVIWLLSVCTNGALRLLGINPKDEEEEVTEEEIRMMVDIGEEKGTIESGEREMIENIFEFSDLSAADVMTHRTDMIAFSLDESEAHIIDVITRSGLSRFPVYEEDTDDIIGILSTRRYLLNLRAAQPKTLRELLFAPYLVPETLAADKLLSSMQQNKIHMAVVLDEYGGTAGIVTMEDLLEEIVGNIYDETDPLDEQEIQKIGAHTWRVAGSTQLETLEKELDVPLCREDDVYDTLGGLIFSQLAAIPADGSHPEVEVNGLHIRVSQLYERRVLWAIITKTAPPEEQSLEK